jgi:hypothetical protein
MKKIVTASLGDADLVRQEIEITKRLTKAERLELCFDLSDFCLEIRDATRRRRSLRQRSHARPVD